jgi:thiamine pyridinylase
MRGDKSPIMIYYYYDFTDTDLFCALLEKRFRETGHDRPLRFIEWNCYKEEPGRDGDLFIFDVVAMSALVDKGYLHELPDVIRTDDMFSWVIDRSKVKKKTYGIPVMICANTLICRRRDDQNIRNIMDLHEPAAIPLKSMLMNYYLNAFCNFQDQSGRCLEVLLHLTDLMGESTDLEKTDLASNEGIRKFNEGEYRYFLGFTESLRLLKPDDYVVRFANFSDYEENQMPLFMADFASMGNHVAEEKMLDCLDLLEIMSDADFIYEMCTANDELQYMLPACMSVYHRLAELDPLYDRLYEMVNEEENGVFRYGVKYYEEFYAKSGALLEMLKQKRREKKALLKTDETEKPCAQNKCSGSGSIAS